MSYIGRACPTELLFIGEGNVLLLWVLLDLHTILTEGQQEDVFVPVPVDPKIGTV